MPRSIEAFGLILLVCVSRLFPHVPNMTATNAIAQRSVIRFGPIGVTLPLAGMVLSDAIIGWYNWKIVASVYGAIAIVGLIRLTRLPLPTMFGSVLFFFITNSAVWAASSWYPPTLAGYFSCLAAGIPFLASMMIGDLLFDHILTRLPFFSIASSSQEALSNARAQSCLS